jgi:L-alanine-DL-glutamate epimerase-like enolase superfamily enzyme
MRARFIPRILAAKSESLLDRTGENLDPEKILSCMMQREKAGGHSERSIPIGTIEVAVWDAVAKIAGKPLHRVLAERYGGGRQADKVFCYVGGGWYAPGQTFADVQDEMRRHLDAGYTMVKMKVGGLPLADDVKRVAAVREVVAPRGARLAVDANCKFGRADGLAYAKALEPLGLAWFEEPCDPLDYALTAEIAAAYAPPLATGENLFSTPDVENLVRFGGLRADRDIIQIDPPQSYGIVQFARTVAMLERHGWKRTSLFPHGGNQMSLHIAGGFGLGGAESYPGVFGAFGGFADDATLSDGYLNLPDRPGIGFEAQNALYKIMKELAA